MKPHRILVGLVALSALAAISVQAAAVKTVSPSQTTIKRTTAQPATVTAYHQAEIISKVDGYVGSIKVDIGDKVKAGQVLAEVSVPEMAYRLEAYLAELDQFQFKRRQLTAEVNVIEAEHSALESENKRIQQLLKTKSVTQKLGDEVASRFEAAKAKLAAAQAQVASLDSQRRKVQATIDETKVMIAYASIKAPFPGIITQRSISPGDYVRTGEGTPLFTVAQVDKLRVTVGIPERDAIWIDKGDKASIQLSALPKPIEATVTRTSGSLDPKTRTLATEIEIINGTGQLLPGMFGKATITMQEKNALVIPANTIRFDQHGDEMIVYVVQNGTVKHVPVTLGLDDGHQIEVLSGLTEQDQIVTGMLGRLKDGASVELIK